MAKGKLFSTGSRLAAALTLGFAGAGVAQQAHAQDAGTEEDIVVTGSYIRGTPEDAALPVDVLSAETLAEQGSPTVVQLVKTLTAAGSSVAGESNRYASAPGVAGVNLRGFGGDRTMTLFNGRRMADSAAQSFGGGAGSDLNFIPQAAVGRVEILKDGAAATYGSDAIGGVVNFITRRDLEGFDVSGEYSAIEGSDGDYQTGVAWGYRGESGNILLAANYRHRSRLDIKERDWAIRPFQSVFYGGWSGNSNPGNYVVNNATTSGGGTFLFRDAGCNELGGQLTTTLSATLFVPTNSVTQSNSCRFQFTNFNDLVNEEDHYNLYAEVNWDIANNLEFHGEAAFNRNNVPLNRLSPANLNTQFPTNAANGGSSGSLATPLAANRFVRYNVPEHNPGLDDIATRCNAADAAAYRTATGLSPAQCASITSAALLGGVGVDFSASSTAGIRAIANAGHPTTATKTVERSDEQTAWRLSGGLNWDVSDWLNLDTAVTYMSSRHIQQTEDLVVNRLQNALNGLGSRQGDPNQCTAADAAVLTPASTVAQRAALGCYYFNPFSNAVAVSAVNGAQNPFYRGGVNPSVINDPLTIANMYGQYSIEIENQLLVFDAVASGNTGINLPGGEIQWALGGQTRYERRIADYSSLADLDATPCVTDVDDLNPTPNFACNLPNGPFNFFSATGDSDTDRNIYAVFGEVNFPILDSLEANLAVRYEDYGGTIGATTNPKISLRYQALDWLAFRSSAGSTFRAPTAASVLSGCSLAVASVDGAYRGVNVCGNPQLEPETADSYALGVLVDVGGFSASVDWYGFEFEGEITTEGATNTLAAMFPGGSTARCGDPAFAALQARFLFTGACTDGPSGALVIDTFFVNAERLWTSGYDIRLQYDFDEVLGGNLSAGLEATYLDAYKRGRISLRGFPAITVVGSDNRDGRHDLQTNFYSFPKVRANTFVTYNHGPATIRWQTRFVEGTEAGTNSPNLVLNAAGTANIPIGKTEDFWQHDLIGRFELPWNITLTASVQNIMDEDPPFAPSNFNYDYTTGNPLGRVFEIGFNARF